MSMRQVGARRRRLVTQAQDPIEVEHQIFLRKLPALLRRYEGRFVAVYRGRVVGHSDDEEELGGRMYERLGEVPLYIGKVERVPSVHEVPSPEIAG